MYPLVLHKNLSLEKWATRSKGQQILMIANELNRAANFISSGKINAVNLCYERAFELTDLTSSDPKWRGHGRELRRFRELLAMQYINPQKDEEMNRALYVGLIRLSAEANRLLFPGKEMKEKE